MKRRWKLGGSSEKYDFIRGCYGNPDSKYVFVAEIPSLSGCEVARQLYWRQPAMSWKCAWKTSTGDLIYRICLSNYGLIKDPLSDKPWTWNCWLTDFVKCADTDGEWKKRKKRHEVDDILSDSATILQNELEIIARNRKNVKVIVVGGEAERLFNRYMKSWIDENGKPSRIDHYARAKNLDPESPFMKKFEDSMRQIGKIPTKSPV